MNNIEDSNLCKFNENKTANSKPQAKHENLKKKNCGQLYTRPWF